MCRSQQRGQTRIERIERPLEQFAAAVSENRVHGSGGGASIFYHTSTTLPRKAAKNREKRWYDLKPPPKTVT